MENHDDDIDIKENIFEFTTYLFFTKNIKGWKNIVCQVDPHVNFTPTPPKLNTV